MAKFVLTINLDEGSVKNNWDVADIIEEISYEKVRTKERGEIFDEDGKFIGEWDIVD